MARMSRFGGINGCPSPYGFSPLRLSSNVMLTGNISDLFLADTRRWDEARPHELFLPHEVESILQIPLCDFTAPDRII